MSLAAVALFLTSPMRAQEEAKPVPLPRVTVSADVPLVKVGQHTMRVARYAPAAVVAGDFIYIIGGQTETDEVLTSVERFDPRRQTSEHFADLQQGRIWHGAVVVGGQIYVLGGSMPHGSANSRGQPVTGMLPDDSVEIIDLATRKVTAGPRLRAARTQFACVQHDGKVYVMGGKTEGRTMRQVITSTVEVLDVGKGKWSAASPMPTPRLPAAVLVDGGFVVAAGGYNGARELDIVEVYDPRRDAWSNLPPLGATRSAHSMVFLGEYLFLFGDYGTPEELLAYNLRTKQSEVFQLGYTPQRHTAAVRHEDKIYVIGGRQNTHSRPSDLIQVFTPTKMAGGR